MKTHIKPVAKHLIAWCAVLTGLALGSTLRLNAQPYPNITRGFDSFAEALSGLGGSGTVVPGVLLDWIDTDGYGTNGCMYMQVPWVDTGGEWQEVQLSWEDPLPWPGIVAAPYATVEYDVKVVEPSSADTNGTYGSVQIILQGWVGAGGNTNIIDNTTTPPTTNNPANWLPLGQVAITNAGTWQHISHRLVSAEPWNINKVIVNVIARDCTNTVTYLLDNISFRVPTNPPPTLEMGTAPPAGLHLLTAGGPADRQIIRTTAANLKWYNRSGPVKYSFTVNKFPSGDTYPNYMAFMLLIPYAPGSSAPDWDSTNCMRLDVQNHGTGTAYLRYKTNAPGSNGGFYTSVAEGGGAFPGVPSSTLLGEWSLTFNNNTNVTVTAADGTSSNYVIEAAANFNGLGFRVYYGAQANDTANIGQEVILAGASISGTATAVSDAFNDGALNAAKWQVQAAQPNNVFELGAVAYNLSWNLPDNLFKFITSTDLGNMTNSALSLTVGATRRSVNIPFNYPGTNLGFFALCQRAYTNLQVLMPGETAAPGTPTGKTGTSVHQRVNVPFQVQVKAVDGKWNQAFCSHPVTLWCAPTDAGSGFTWADQLVHGSYSYTFTNTVAGTFQINVQDLSNTNITGIGSSYTVDP